MRRLGLAVGLAVASVVVALAPASAQGVYNTPGSEKATTPTIVREVSNTVTTVLASRFQQVGTQIFNAPAPGPTGGTVRTGTVQSTGQTGLSGAAQERGIGVWANVGYNRIESEFARSAYKGDVYAGLAGVDVRVRDWLVLGVALGYENLDVDTAFNTGTIESSGVSVTPYAIARLSREFFVDLSAGYTSLTTDVSRGGGAATGSYDSDRFVAGANLNWSWNPATASPWRLGASVGYLYIRQEDDSYRESAGAFVGSNTTEIGQARVGGRVGYSFGAVEPYVSGRFEYDAKQASIPIITSGGTTGPAASDDRTGFVLGLGTRFTLAPNLTGGIEVNTVEGRDDFTNYGVLGNIRFTF